MSIAVRDGDAITVADAQWQRETLVLALDPRQQPFESVQQ
jgi:hypothetical protein